MYRMSDKEFYSTMRNRDLIKTYNKIKKEKENKRLTGSYGTGRYISSTEFYGKKGYSAIKQELERRKQAGQISRTAGVRRKTNNYGFFFNQNSGRGLFRF